MCLLRFVVQFGVFFVGRVFKSSFRLRLLPFKSICDLSSLGMIGGKIQDIVSKIPVKLVFMRFSASAMPCTQL